MCIKFLVVLLQISSIFVSAYKPSSLDQVVAANLAFVPELFNVIQKQPSLKNFVFSPLSAQAGLALLRSGTKGTTKEQLGSAVHLSYPQNEINEGYRTLLTTFKTEQGCTFHSANKLYIKKGFKINPRFKKTAAGDYDSEIENIDFAAKNNPANAINSWVEKQTAHTIKGLIQPNSLDANIKVLLVNALYLSAPWAIPFQKAGTKSRDFELLPHKLTVHVSTMHQVGYFNYLKSKALNMTFLEVDLGGENSTASVIFILRDGPLSSNIAQTANFTLNKVYDDFNFKKELVDVLLPKFNIATVIDFKKTLKSLGVSDLFSSKADLSGIAGKKGELFADNIVQKAVIGINEQGLRGGSAGEKSLKPTRPADAAEVPKLFHANRPFYFIVRVENVVAFAGRVSDPRF